MIVLLADPVTVQLFPEEPLYEIRATLNGREYVLRFDYTQREDRWYLSLYDSQGSPITKGIKITANTSTLRLARHDTRTPRGALIFSDVTEQFASPPGFTELGRRVLLTYSEAV